MLLKVKVCFLIINFLLLKEKFLSKKITYLIPELIQI